MKQAKNKFQSGVVICIWISFVVISCRIEDKVDLQLEKKKLLDIHLKDQKGHIDLDVKALTDNVFDTLISVVDGKVAYIEKQEQSKHFNEYFKNAMYIQWYDIEAPIVQISEDATLAWMINRVKVSRSSTDSSGRTHRINFIYAGIMTYKKENKQWFKQANVSTFQIVN